MNLDACTPEEIERFRIDHAGEIERILRAVMAKRALVTAYCEDERDFLVTTLVALDSAKHALYFGTGPDAAIDRALTVSRVVTFNTSHDQVRVVFKTPAMTVVERDGEKLLRADMPAELLRFQRREYYRLPTPMTHPVKCQIDLGGYVLDAVVVDISIGGVGLLAYSQDAALKEGEVHHGCRLSLPDAGSFAVSLRVRTVYEQVMKNGLASRRLGCQFIDLAPSLETDIQRYIIRVERDRRLHGL
ncbi:flagellar brake protein [Parasulfuritortus cantonensis]|uniref:Flagellar brake protein YcgR n=1 Tax=Parasulfuritortus cantonensis TaxID=2528202 RepID=A0A4R1BIX7_9PROT|nr:flagellar brake protein [Parasulfuritortus cantonensis]TCJ17231.1 flagellar brake protein [Parasulfuritortus cantonensis]